MALHENYYIYFLKIFLLFQIMLRMGMFLARECVLPLYGVNFGDNFINM